MDPFHGRRAGALDRNGACGVVWRFCERSGRALLRGTTTATTTGMTSVGRPVLSWANSRRRRAQWRDCWSRRPGMVCVREWEAAGLPVSNIYPCRCRDGTWERRIPFGVTSYGRRWAVAHGTSQVKRVAHAPQNYTPERGATTPRPSASLLVLSSHLADHVSASALTGRPFTALHAAAPEKLPALPLRWRSWMWSVWRLARARRIACSRGRMPGTEPHPDPPWLSIHFVCEKWVRFPRAFFCISS